VQPCMRMREIKWSLIPKLLVFTGLILAQSLTAHAAFSGGNEGLEKDDLAVFRQSEDTLEARILKQATWYKTRRNRVSLVVMAGAASGGALASCTLGMVGAWVVAGIYICPVAFIGAVNVAVKAKQILFTPVEHSAIEVMRQMADELEKTQLFKEISAELAEPGATGRRGKGDDAAEALTLALLAADDLNGVESEYLDHAPPRPTVAALIHDVQMIRKQVPWTTQQARMINLKEKIAVAAPTEP
jgi:hypothetical protein